MLIIRQVQMDSMAQAAGERLLQQVAGAVQAASPGKPVDAAALAETVDFARRCGLTQAQQVARMAVALDGTAAEDLPRDVSGPLLAYGGDPESKLTALESWSESQRAAQSQGGAGSDAQAGQPPAAAPSSTRVNVAPVAVVEACPERQSTHWLEIELVGEDGAGISWTAYEVMLPSGEVTAGYLDGQGFARFDGLITAGSCKIRFPEIDKDAVSFIESTSERPR
jgi:hypothetical protein